MKKNNKTFFLGLCALAVVLTVAFSLGKKPAQNQNQVDEMMITQEDAEAEIAIIKITAEETEFLQQIVKSEEVAKAKTEGKDTILTAEAATKLAQEFLSADAKIDEFSYRNKSVYVDYYVGEYRVIYEFAANDTLHKFVGVLDENKNAKALYENTDNKTYKKTVFNTITK